MSQTRSWIVAALAVGALAAVAPFATGPTPVAAADPPVIDWRCVPTMMGTFRLACWNNNHPPGVEVAASFCQDRPAPICYGPRG